MKYIEYLKHNEEQIQADELSKLDHYDKKLRKFYFLIFDIRKQS